jgi:N-acetylmuramoyl-L-alanine amidase
VTLSKNISTDQFNNSLRGFSEKVRINDISSILDKTTSTFTSANYSTLGRTPGQTVSGIESLTSETDDLAENLIKGVGITRINSAVPGFESLLTTTSSGINTSSISKITGGAPSIGNLKEIITSNSPASISGALSSVTGSAPNLNVLSSITTPEFSSEILSSVNQLPSLSSQLKSTISSLTSAFEGSPGSIKGGMLNKIVSGTGDALRNEIGIISKGLIPDSVIDQVADLILDGDKSSAIDLILSSGEFQEEDIPSISASIDQIDPSLSNVINSKGNSKVDFGERSTVICELGSDEQQWDNFSGGGGSTPSGKYNFTFVNSFEELVSDFRATTREITEVVVHWTAHYIDQGHVGSEEVHQIGLSRGFAGCSYHYIIKRDGSIQRGRPINKMGAHALENGHNRYSIGVSFVAGYNCASGTSNRERYVSSESISSEQWNSMDQFARAFYDVWPGGQFWGHNDTDPQNKPDPGIDVPEYVYRKFRKKNISSSGSTAPLSPNQIAGTS